MTPEYALCFCGRFYARHLSYSGERQWRGREPRRACSPKCRSQRSKIEAAERERKDRLRELLAAWERSGQLRLFDSG